MVLGIFIILVLLSSAWLVKKYKQNYLVMGLYVILSFISTIVVMTVKNTDTATCVGRLFSSYIVLTLWIGNAAGPQVFLTKDAPRYFIAFSTHMGCYVILVTTIVFLRFHLKQQNRKKDELAVAGVREANDQKMVHALEDLTDRENPNFRYMY